MKTFIVIGSTDYGCDIRQETLYVGQDKSKAMSFNLTNYFHTLELEVWEKEMLIKSYSKYNDNTSRWRVEFDKLKTIEYEIEVKRSEMEKAEKELNDLKNFLNNENNK